MANRLTGNAHKCIALAPFKPTPHCIAPCFPPSSTRRLYRSSMAICRLANPSLACGDHAGTRARQYRHACRQAGPCYSFFASASGSSSRATTTPSSAVHMWVPMPPRSSQSLTTMHSDFSEEDSDESMSVVEEDEEDIICVGSDVDWMHSTLMRPDTHRQVAMDLDASSTFLHRSWSSTPSTSVNPSPATSVLSLKSATTSISTSTRSSQSPHSAIPIPGGRSTPACVPTTGEWAHLPPPPGYVPNQARKTAYNAEQRLAHLEADEFCTHVRTTAVYCLGCRKDIALDARFAFYPTLWLKHRRKCVGVQMLAMGYKPKGNRGREEALVLVQRRTGKKRYQRRAPTKKKPERTALSRLDALAEAAHLKALTAPASPPIAILPHAPTAILPPVALPALGPRRQACPLSKILC
ncbi:hypothetical protein C8F01DRAFT_146402 [Mycena amicta]|nr:hypothetical protein C8F01DRAFT_146402 [Mycena amicta]